MCFIRANCRKQYIFKKRLLSVLPYFSVTKSGASESRYDLTKPGTPLIDLGSQVVSIEPQEKCFHEIFHLPNPFSLDVCWLAPDLCSWNKDDPIVDMSCHARISGPLGKFYSISIPFQSSHHCHLRIKIFATCVLSYSPLESGKQWNSFIQREKEEKTADRKKQWRYPIQRHKT